MESGWRIAKYLSKLIATRINEDRYRPNALKREKNIFILVKGYYHERYLLQIKPAQTKYEIAKSLDPSAEMETLVKNICSTESWMNIPQWQESKHQSKLNG